MQLLLSTGNPLEIEGEFLGEPWVRVQAPQVSGRPYDFKTWFIQRLQKFVVTCLDLLYFPIFCSNSICKEI